MESQSQHILHILLDTFYTIDTVYTLDKFNIIDAFYTTHRVYTLNTCLFGWLVLNVTSKN